MDLHATRIEAVALRPRHKMLDVFVSLFGRNLLQRRMTFWRAQKLRLQHEMDDWQFNKAYRKTKQVP